MRKANKLTVWWSLENAVRIRDEHFKQNLYSIGNYLIIIQLFEKGTPSLYARHIIRLVLHTHKQKERETIHAFSLYDDKLFNFFKDRLSYGGGGWGDIPLM